MTLTATTIGVLAALTFGAPAQEQERQEHFPASTALAEGVSPDALANVGKLVQSLVDDEEIVGAELLVLKNGRSILHEAYGWNDRDSATPMQTGSVFCVRSMTKPFIGAAILMLIDDRALKLDDEVAQYLPAFDVDGSREITVEHLLMHTSGLPMSLILGKDLKELDGIQAVAALGGGHELDFAPGSDFQYSDQGTDTLTALVEVVSGMSAAEFVRTRLLDPLGMQDTACVLTEDHPLRARGCSKYYGSRGAWTRFWSPEDAPLFRFFLGSQGMYSTLEDYARFMDLWLDKGRVGKERLLGSRYVKKALTPSPHPFPGPTGLPGLHADYGYLMQLWMRPGEEGEPGALGAFGHTGSDGTHAWVFPEEKAMVLYFTQSRGNTTGLQMEEALGELFFGVPFDANQAAPPLEQYLGYYWEGEGDLYRAIVRDGEDLALEILGKGIVPLSYMGDDRWKFRPNPSVVLEFDRADSGEVNGYHIGDHREFRFDPQAELPDADELAQRVADAHRVDLLESLGPLRMNGGISIEKLGITGEQSAVLAWPDRFRVDSEMGEVFEQLAYDGEHVRYGSSTQPRSTLEGERAEALRLDNTFARFGDWHAWHPRLQVIQQLVRGGKEVYLVRTGDTSAPASTMYVEAETGRVLRIDAVMHMEGLGRVGMQTTFSDFRDVSGMTLPFRSETQVANPLIGSIVSTIEDAELGAELPEGGFGLGE